MKKKYVYILMFLSLFIGLVGCTAEEEREVMDLRIEFVNNRNLVRSRFIEDANLASPNGLLFDGAYIYIADTEKNQVVVYDKYGEFVRFLGNGDIEFNLPIAISINDYGEIFVAERSTGIVRVIADDIQIDEIFIDEIRDGMTYVTDIEIDLQGNIYISVLSFNSSNQRIFVINEQRELITIGENNVGILGRDETGGIFFAQTYEVFEESIGSGNSFFSRIVDNEFVEKNVLPYRYAPASIFSRNGLIYTFSHGMTQLDVFDIEGNYIETIFEEVASSSNTGLFYIIPFLDSFLVTDRESGVVYIIRDAE